MAKTAKSKGSPSAPTKKIKQKVSRPGVHAKTKTSKSKIPKTIRNFIEDKGS
jgi:hypothetical protein